MYQQSRKVLIFLVVIFLAIRIANAGMIGIMMTQTSAEEFVLSGTYQCNITYAGNSIFLISMTWILGIVWEVLALCFAIWIAVNASFFANACFQIAFLSPTLSAVRRSVTDLYVCPRFINSIVHLFPEHSDLFWCH
ncbi:uncharacterized protein EDB93DRAFT_1143581 [Suillus bovinus]|uniref:uncharacterized protein n=1 Tax=Suillus bovinus TaxID=48563 RepID=UPI001B87EA97|nr:uncharacterized protein EDB93DRAFT_1143581 [Suillus bovinus]KAG2149086.1 hypothetical protein EDB93DRAFT_1143581 [Suillus bovinus]